jgi:hypothetical protein
MTMAEGLGSGVGVAGGKFVGDGSGVSEGFGVEKGSPAWVSGLGKLTSDRIGAWLVTETRGVERGGVAQPARINSTRLIISERRMFLIVGFSIGGSFELVYQIQVRRSSRAPE